MRLRVLLALLLLGVPALAAATHVFEHEATLGPGFTLLQRAHASAVDMAAGETIHATLEWAEPNARLILRGTPRACDVLRDDGCGGGVPRVLPDCANGSGEGTTRELDFTAPTAGAYRFRVITALAATPVAYRITLDVAADRVTGPLGGTGFTIPVNAAHCDV